MTVTNTNDAPVLGNNTLSISEGGSVTLSGSDLSASDADGDALTYNVTNVTGGQFELSTNPGVAVTSFTQVQLTASQVVFVHDGGDTSKWRLKRHAERQFRVYRCSGGRR